MDVIAELRGLLYDKLVEASEARKAIERAIQSVDDERLRLLLEYRYIDGARWEEVAVKMCLEYRWVLVLHGRALDELTIEMHIKPMI